MTGQDVNSKIDKMTKDVNAEIERIQKEKSITIPTDIAQYPAKMPPSIFDTVKDSGKRKEFDKVQSSGEEQAFTTGAVRDLQKGKGRWDLIPYKALQRLAVHFENGAARYAENNWRKGIPLKVYLNSAARHLYKLIEGLDDEDHASACLWNIVCFIHTQECIEEGKLPKELDNTVRSTPCEKP